MKLIFLVGLSLMVKGIFSPAFAQRQPIDGDWNSPKCIEEVWKRTKPTEEEKKYDLENDPSLTGHRFSCFSQLSPTEINRTLQVIKEAIQTDDKEKLSDLVVYPFNYWVETEEYDPDYGNFKPLWASNKQEFIEQYDEIVTPNVKKIMECTTISKIVSNGEGSLLVATDFIHIRKQPDFINGPIQDYNQYPLRIALIGSYFERVENWYTTQCK